MHIFCEKSVYLINATIHKCIAVSTLIKRTPFSNVSGSGGIKITQTGRAKKAYLTKLSTTISQICLNYWEVVRSIWNADDKHRTSSKCVTFNTQKYITRLKEVGSIYHKCTYPLTQNFTYKIISKNYAQNYITQMFTVAFFL